MTKKLVEHRFDLDNPPPLSDEQKAEIERLLAMPEESIDFSDIPEKSDWSRTVRLRDRLYRPVKESTTIRIDADVLHLLKAKGRGYQTRLNAILREAMVRDAAGR